MPIRLQLGASRLEKLDCKVLKVFLDKTWIHLGDEDEERLTFLARLKKACQENDFSSLVKRSFLKIFKENIKSKITINHSVLQLNNFMPFFYQKWDRLPFEDNNIDYIFSEHFFEHLFFDEALALFKECHRILKPGCLIRTCVPDADLRTYEPPEPVGYPGKRIPFTHPAKHKTRWNVYSLSEALRLAKFYTIPLRYCDKFGQYYQVEPSSKKESYERCADHEMAFNMDHIFRIDSLIIDGIKET